MGFVLHPELRNAAIPTAVPCSCLDAPSRAVQVGPSRVGLEVRWRAHGGTERRQEDQNEAMDRAGQNGDLSPAEPRLPRDRKEEREDVRLLGEALLACRADAVTGVLVEADEDGPPAPLVLSAWSRAAILAVIHG